MSFTSTFSEEKENGEAPYPRNKALSPDGRYAGSAASSGRGSPARGFRSATSYRDDGSDSGSGIARERPGSSLPQPSAGNGAESWKRAAEVTSQLKARIEQMKVSLPTECFIACRLVHHLLTSMKGQARIRSTLVINIWRKICGACWHQQGDDSLRMAAVEDWSGRLSGSIFWALDAYPLVLILP